MEPIYLIIGINNTHNVEHPHLWWRHLDDIPFFFGDGRINYFEFRDAPPSDYYTRRNPGRFILGNRQHDQNGNPVDLHELKRIHEDPLADLGNLNDWGIVVFNNGQDIRHLLSPDHTPHILSRHNLNIKHIDSIMQSLCAYSSLDADFNDAFVASVVMSRNARTKLKKKIENMNIPVERLCRIVERDIFANAIIRSLTPGGITGGILRNHHEQDRFFLPGERGNVESRTFSDRLDEIIVPVIDMFVGRGDVEIGYLKELQQLLLTRNADSLPDPGHFYNVAMHIKNPWNARLIIWPETPEDLPRHSTLEESLNRPDPEDGEDPEE